ncbi:unnamed protein product [Oikopleura dioica]|uniref:Uncharacterized protein n=1 Tax=Oikopleura dioica TaxID=34765 RepID=E4XLX2_OIKDI|nr:unnamed protein product [Oikopleura dioica]
MSEIGTAKSINKQFVFSEDVFEENLIVEESLAENQPLVKERRIIREEVSILSGSCSQKSIMSSSASLCSKDSVSNKDKEEPFEVVESSPDKVENADVNIFLENSQNGAKSDSPRTVISEDDIEEERKKMEEGLKFWEDDYFLS